MVSVGEGVTDGAGVAEVEFGLAIGVDNVVAGLGVLEMLVLLTGVGDDVMVGGELAVKLLLTIGVGCIVPVGELEGVADWLIDESDSSAMVAATKLESEAELGGCIVSVGEGVAVGLVVLELLLAAGVGGIVAVGAGLGLVDPSPPVSSSIPSSIVFCFFLFVSSSITSLAMSLSLMAP